jgi:hypothetical protein
VDFALLKCSGDFAKDVDPIPLADRYPSDQSSVTTFGSPRCEWPSLQVLRLNRKEGQILSWKPEAIGGRSGSSIIDYTDEGPRVVGLLTWAGGGDTGGGTQHVTQSIANVGKYSASGFTAPDFFGAIGVTDDRVEGTDVTVPVFNFTETHYIPNLLVTGAYKLTLFNLTGKVNGATFKGFAKGEVLFLGASGSKRGLDDWEITFRFAASPNVAGLSLGSITGIAKEGWQYLWVRFIDDEDTTAKALIKRPVSAYVEQVYSYGDFSGLGIGV